MNNQLLDELRERLGRKTLDILLPIRMTRQKIIKTQDAVEVLSIISDINNCLSEEISVPKDVVGELYFLFTQLLSEADHAANPEPIVNFAWQIQNELHKIFGPKF